MTKSLWTKIINAIRRTLFVEAVSKSISTTSCTRQRILAKRLESICEKRTAQRSPLPPSEGRKDEE